MVSGIDSATAKIERAAEHLNALNSLAIGAGAYEIVADPNGDEYIHFLVDPPVAITVLVGEIVYHLRSALDHLAFDLVQMNPSGIKLPDNWFNKCCFPLWLRIPAHLIKGGHNIPPLPYNCFSDTLPGISKAAFAFIEVLQPYRSGQGTHNIMRLLAELSNIDRHRYFNVTIPKGKVSLDVKFASGYEGTTTLVGLEDGTKLGHVDSKYLRLNNAVEVKRRFSSYVTFDEPSVGAGNATHPVNFLLENCLEMVKRVVVPAFIQLLKNP